MQLLIDPGLPSWLCFPSSRGSSGSVDVVRDPAGGRLGLQQEVQDLGAAAAEPSCLPLSTREAAATTYFGQSPNDANAVVYTSKRPYVRRTIFFGAGQTVRGRIVNGRFRSLSV